MAVLPVLASLLLTLPAPVTPAAAPQACDGVTVAVALPGELLVRCSSGTTAREALDNTGLDIETGSNTGGYDEPDYVCRIDGYPQTGDCTGHEDGDPYWKVWRVGIDPVAWRASQTSGGPAAVPVCPGSLVGFSFGGQMPVDPTAVVTTPGWLPPNCR
ncbi:hypothetical protein [Amycolatopsis magusensis]|uniref:hypothetical protein n=1 Tax=Amycolatopsis magusensis TaxID=882444 RepID=UPI003C2CA05B